MPVAEDGQNCFSVTGCQEIERAGIRLLTDLENCFRHPCGDCHVDRSFQKPRMSQDPGLPLHSVGVKNCARGAPPSLFPLHDSNTTGGTRSWTQRKQCPRAKTPYSLIPKCSSRGRSQIDQEPTQLTQEPENWSLLTEDILKWNGLNCSYQKQLGYPSNNLKE